MPLDQLRAVECELSKKEVEVRSLKSQLESASHHTEEFKTIAKTMEEEFGRFKEEKEKELGELRAKVKANEEASQSLKEEEAKKKAQESAAEANEGKLKKEIVELQGVVASQKRELEELKTRLEVEKQASSTMEQNYIAEFQKHAKSTQEWNEKEKQLEKEKSELRAMKEELAKKQEEEKQKEEAKKKEEERWKELLAEKELRLDSLTKQNDVLFDQISQLTRRDRDAMGEKVDSAVKNETPLREVVVSLRRDCEIAKSSLALQKTLLSEKEKSLNESETRVNALSEELKEEIRVLGELKSKGDIDEVLKREKESIRLLAVYTESNNALRQENEAINEELRKMKEEEEATKKVNEELKAGYEERLKKEQENRLNGVKELKKKENLLQSALDGEKKAKVALQSKVNELEQRVKLLSAQRMAQSSAQPVSRQPETQQAHQTPQALKTVPQTRPNAQVATATSAQPAVRPVTLAKPAQALKSATVPSTTPVGSAPAKSVTPAPQPLSVQGVKTQPLMTQGVKTQPLMTQGVKTQPSLGAQVKSQPSLAPQGVKTQPSQPPKAQPSQNQPLFKVDTSEGAHPTPFTRRLSADATPFAGAPARLFTGILNTQALKPATPTTPTTPATDEAALQSVAKKAKTNEGAAVETATLNEKMMNRKQRFAWEKECVVTRREGLNPAAQQQPQQPQRKKDGERVEGEIMGSDDEVAVPAEAAVSHLHPTEHAAAELAGGARGEEQRKAIQGGIAGACEEANRTERR